jgi:hypothetical protein
VLFFFSKLREVPERNANFVELLAARRVLVWGKTMHRSGICGYCLLFNFPASDRNRSHGGPIAGKQ